MDAGTGNISEYSHEFYAAFPAKAYLERFKDPKTDPTKTQMHFLKGFHSFYEEYISSRGDSLSLLEFGGGPTLFTLISAAKHVESITYAEYAETNRNEIQMWKDEKKERKFYSGTPSMCNLFKYNQRLLAGIKNI